MDTELNPRGEGPLRVSGVVRSADRLSLRVQFDNVGAETLYVLDSPWLIDIRTTSLVRDPEGCYRSLASRSGALRIILGEPPLPVGSTVTVRLTPLATPVAAAARHAIELSLPLPVAEYNPYFSADAASKYEDLSAPQLDVFTQYVIASRDLVVETPAWGGGKVLVRPVPSATYAVASAPGPVPVRRRLDPFSRLVLPGEPPQASTSPFAGFGRL